MTHPPLLPHGEIQEIFPDIFFVTGGMEGEFFGSHWEFGRNMFIVRSPAGPGDIKPSLTVINGVRLSEAGMGALDALGRVDHLLKIGSMHSRDDAYFVERYSPTVWGIPGMPLAEGVTIDQKLTEGVTLPIADASVFLFRETKLPEAIVRLDREGGILLACDALQNWEEPDPFTSDDSIEKMRAAGFFVKANCGVAWMHVNEPQPGDFARLKELTYQHALAGHGTPLLGTAQADFAATFKRLYDV